MPLELPFRPTASAWPSYARTLRNQGTSYCLPRRLMARTKGSSRTGRKSLGKAGFLPSPLGRIVWMPDSSGLVVVYQRGIGFVVRSQLGFISNPAGKFHTITNDTNSYQTLTLSADGKTLATVQQKNTQTLYLMPATGFVANPPSPAPAQSKNASMFGWATDGDLYFGDDSNLLRMSPDGSNKTTLFSEPSSKIIFPKGCPGGRYVVF